MVQPIVALLPEPVMPSRVWNRLPGLDALNQARDGLRLVARGLIIGDHLEGRHRADRTEGVLQRFHPGPAFVHRQRRSSGEPQLSMTKSARSEAFLAGDLGGDAPRGVVGVHLPLAYEAIQGHLDRAVDDDRAGHVVGVARRSPAAGCRARRRCRSRHSPATRSLMVEPISGHMIMLRSLRAASSANTIAAMAGRSSSPSARTTPGTKALHDRLKSRAVGCLQLARDRVRVDQHRAAFDQQRRCARFARADPARKGHHQHGRKGTNRHSVTSPATHLEWPA